MGHSVGLSAIWVMFAILIGGGLFGFVGMILGIPIFAMIYQTSREIVKTRLKNKSL
jgi:predicted PurR-regulated permease PerM